MDLAKLVVRLEAQTADYQKKLDQATGRLERFKKANDNLLASVGGKLAAAFTVGAVVAWGKTVLDNAGHLHDMAEASGVSASKLQELQVAAKASGADLDTLGTGLKKLSKNLVEAAGNPSSEAAAAFRAMGIAITDASGNLKSTDVILGELADKFAGYEDGPEKVAIAMTLLGKSGADLIPMLNNGSKGFEEFGRQAREAGLVLGDETIKRLDDMGDKLELMKSSLVYGLGGAIMEKLLPAFENLGAAWDKTGDKTKAYQSIAETVSNFFKVLATGVITAGGILTDFGEVLGAVAAAAVQVAHGNFSEAKDILASIPDELAANDEDVKRRITALWSDVAKIQSDGIEEVVVVAKKKAPNIAGGKALEDAAKKARETLQKLYTDIRSSVDTFGQGDSAVLHYRLTIGDLADEVKAAGAAGQTLVSSIEAQAAALEKMKVAKEVADAVADMNTELLKLSGDSVGAALAEFDQQHLDTMTKAAQAGDIAAMNQINHLRELTVAQAQYSQLQQDAQDVSANLAIQEERINNSREAGAITELEQAQQLSDSREQAVSQLQQIYEKMQAIAEASGNPDMVRGVAQMGAEIDKLGAQTNLVGKQFKAVFEDGLGNAIQGILTGTQSVSDAMKGLLNDLEAQLAKMVANDLVQRLFAGLSGMGGTGGGIFSFLGGLFGGTMDSGGRGSPGQVYAIGAGAQPEYFVPDSHGTFYPKGKGMGGSNTTITQQFSIQAPNGSVSRQTQQQIAAAASRGMLVAQRRNT